MENERPRWLSTLNEEDLQLIKRFILTSGSLKSLAEEYGISYPTIRARLDRLIAKVRAADDPSVLDAFHRQLQIAVADKMLSAGIARKLLEAHREVMDAKEREMKGESHARPGDFTT